MGFLRFLRQFALPVFLTVSATLIAIFDTVSRVELIWNLGLPGWVWGPISGMLFLLALLVFFYQIHRRLEVSTAIIKPTTEPAEITVTAPSVPQIVNQNVTSNSQFGGITAHTVNLAPRRRLDNVLKAELLKLPRDRPISVAGIMGDTESLEFADQLRLFLEESGFISPPPDQSVVQVTPMRPIRGLAFGLAREWASIGDGYILVVGSAPTGRNGAS
jgi:hypothetical protein